MWWLLRDLVKKPAPLTAEQQEFVRQLANQCPAVSHVQVLILDFAPLVRERRTKALTRWLGTAQACEVPELVRFVASLLKDRKAVYAACSSRWSNGQTEGQITRLKLLKRQMFGRANFDLLKARLLLAA